MDGLGAAELAGYRRWRECPACGSRPGWWTRWRSRWLAGDCGNFQSRACFGGKEPTEQGRVVTPLGAVEVEQRWSCAGILEPHLHLVCRSCGLSFLSRPRLPVQGMGL